MKEQIIVYYIGEKPDTVYVYVNDDNKNYGYIHSYFLEGKHYEKTNKDHIRMDYDTFMTRIVPNKECCKFFTSIDEFMGEYFVYSL